MKHLISTQSLAALALAVCALTAAASVHARSDAHVSFGVQAPGVYVQPRPIYVPAPSHFGRYDDGRRHDGPHWQRRGPYGDHDRDGIANVYDSGGPRHQWRQSHLYGPYGDLDRDGIRNQWDHDVDGDGVRNRYDRAPTNPYRR